MPVVGLLCKQKTYSHLHSLMSLIIIKEKLDPSYQKQFHLKIITFPENGNNKKEDQEEITL